MWAIGAILLCIVLCTFIVPYVLRCIVLLMVQCQRKKQYDTKKGWVKRLDQTSVIDGDHEASSASQSVKSRNVLVWVGSRQMFCQRIKPSSVSSASSASSATSATTALVLYHPTILVLSAHCNDTHTYHQWAHMDTEHFQKVWQHLAISPDLTFVYNSRLSVSESGMKGPSLTKQEFHTLRMQFQIEDKIPVLSLLTNLSVPGGDAGPNELYSTSGYIMFTTDGLTDHGEPNLADELLLWSLRLGTVTRWCKRLFWSIIN